MVTVRLAFEFGRCWLSDSRRRRAARWLSPTRSESRLNRRVLGTVTMPVSWAELGGPGVAGRCHANHVLTLSLTAVTVTGPWGRAMPVTRPLPVLPAPAHGWRWPARGSVLPVIEVLELRPPQAVMISAFVGQVGGHVSTADLAADTWRQKTRQPVESQCEGLPRSA